MSEHEHAGHWSENIPTALTVVEDTAHGMEQAAHHAGNLERVAQIQKSMGGASGAMGMAMGPLEMLLGIRNLFQGIRNGDVEESVLGGMETVGGGFSTVAGIGSLAEIPAMAAVAPVGAVMGTAVGSWKAGRALYGEANEHSAEAGWHHGMNTDEYAFEEGQKVERRMGEGTLAGRLMGADRAGGAALIDTGRYLVNGGAIPGMPPGLVDAYYRNANADEDAAKYANIPMPSAGYDEPGMGNMSSTAHELSPEIQAQVWAFERQIREINEALIAAAHGEIQMPNMDMRRPAAKSAKKAAADVNRHYAD